MAKFFDTLFLMFIALTIVGALVGLVVWIDRRETCRDAGYSRRVFIDGRGYCIRAVDGIVEGRPVTDVIERMSGVADWE